MGAPGTDLAYIHRRLLIEADLGIPLECSVDPLVIQVSILVRTLDGNGVLCAEPGACIITAQIGE